MHFKSALSSQRSIIKNALIAVKHRLLVGPVTPFHPPQTGTGRNRPNIESGQVSWTLTSRSAEEPRGDWPRFWYPGKYFGIVPNTRGQGDDEDWRGQKLSRHCLLRSPDEAPIWTSYAFLNLSLRSSLNPRTVQSNEASVGIFKLIVSK